MINLAVQKDTWKPIQIDRGAPKLEHLAFLDYLLLLDESNLAGNYAIINRIF